MLISHYRLSAPTKTLFYKGNLWQKLNSDFFIGEIKQSHCICKPAYLVPVEAKINWEGCGRKGILRDEGGGSLISPDGVVPSQTVSVSVSDISPCTINHHTTTILVLRPFFRLLLGLVW